MNVKKIFLLVLILVGAIQAQSSDSLQEIVGLIQKKYYRKISSRQFSQAITLGLRKILQDPYIQYYSACEYERLQREISGKYQGIGAVVKKTSKGLLVISPIKGGPADKAGLKIGDFIVSIDGHEVSPEDSLISLVYKLRGRRGSSVMLSIIRPVTQEKKRIKLVRDSFSFRAYNYKILTGNIAYLKIKFFNKNISKQIQETLKLFQKNNTIALILDLRGCYGGVLKEVLAVGGIIRSPRHHSYAAKTRE